MAQGFHVVGGDALALFLLLSELAGVQVDTPRIGNLLLPRSFSLSIVPQAERTFHGAYAGSGYAFSRNGRLRPRRRHARPLQGRSYFRQSSKHRCSSARNPAGQIPGEQAH